MYDITDGYNTWYWSISPISFGVSSLALVQLYDYPRANEATLRDMGEWITWTGLLNEMIPYLNHWFYSLPQYTVCIKHIIFVNKICLPMWYLQNDIHFIDISMCLKSTDG